MDPRKLQFYTEQYEKANRKMKLTEEFVAIPKKQRITAKFYSKYETLGEISAPDEYIKLIERFSELSPKDIYCYRPPAVNMDYGWFPEPLIPRSKDPRLNFSLRESNVVKTETKIRLDEKNYPQKKFVGIPFKT